MSTPHTAAQRRADTLAVLEQHGHARLARMTGHNAVSDTCQPLAATPGTIVR